MISRSMPGRPRYDGWTSLFVATAVWIAGATLNADGPYQLDAVCFLPRNQPKELAPGNPAPSTRRMAALLARINNESDPTSMAYLSDRVVEKIATAIQGTTNVVQQVNLRVALARRQTQSGRPDQALNTYLEIDQLLAASGIALNDAGRMEVRARRAVAFLRLGEQENCIGRHNAESCLFPLSPAARHHMPRGSRGAMALLEEQLKELPSDLSSRWLLNLAYMTLGEYPDKVPSQWLIPPSAFESEYKMPRFPDISASLELDVNDLAGGVIVDDFNNDGFLDIFASSSALTGQIQSSETAGTGRSRSGPARPASSASPAVSTSSRPTTTTTATWTSGFRAAPGWPRPAGSPLRSCATMATARSPT